MNKKAAAKATGATGAAEDGFRIGAVSRLTGIAVPTIRMWERRYTVVKPGRSEAGGRRYSRAEVDRLALLKAAVEAGHAIGTVARLSDEDLRARLDSGGLRRAAAGGSCRVVVAGEALAERLEADWQGRTQLELAGQYADLATLVAARPQADALLIDMPVLHASAIRGLVEAAATLTPRLVVVLYGFAGRSTLKRLDREGIAAVRVPADSAHLARLCLLSLNLVPREVAEGVDRLMLRAVAPRRYSDLQLVRIGRLESAIRCECPQHLSSLLISLNAFEQYSLDCESADVRDAATHAMLYAAAAQCRHLLENALEHVLDSEGLGDSV